MICARPVERLKLEPVRQAQGRLWVEAAKGQMRRDSGSVEFGFSFGLTDQVARNLGRRDPAALQPDEVARAGGGNCRRQRAVDGDVQVNAKRLMEQSVLKKIPEATAALAAGRQPGPGHSVGGFEGKSAGRGPKNSSKGVTSDVIEGVYEELVLGWKQWIYNK